MALGLLLLCSAWLGYLIWSLSQKAVIAWNEEHLAKAQYASLEARRKVLEARLQALQTPRGQDAAIREAFGVAKLGEEVIVVLPQPVATSTPERSWWQKVLDWF